METEDGEVIERAVAKAEFRKRAALFPLDAGPGLEEGATWVAYAVPLALEWDLVPDDFFQPVTVATLASQLHDLGFDASRNVPLALKREVAEDQYAEFLVGGSIDRADGGYRVTLTLHEVADGSLVAEAGYEGPDLLDLVDEMSVTLKTALEIPARDGIDDLPVRERLTSNAAAWEEYVQGMTSLVVGENLDASIEHMTAAARLDPTFTRRPSRARGSAAERQSAGGGPGGDQGGHGPSLPASGTGRIRGEDRVLLHGEPDGQGCGGCEDVGRPLPGGRGRAAQLPVPAAVERRLGRRARDAE